MEYTTIEKEGRYYYDNGRLAYTPNTHYNQYRPYTKKELYYICALWDKEKVNAISIFLGRTPNGLSEKVMRLKISGEFEQYRVRAAKVLPVIPELKNELTLDEWEKSHVSGMY